MNLLNELLVNYITFVLVEQITKYRNGREHTKNIFNHLRVFNKQAI